MNFFVVLLFFIIWRLFDFLILYLAPKFIPYLGFFPYKEILPLYHLPEWLTKLANFDGVHYLLISQQGYMQYEQAYFPLYPLLVKLLTPIFFNNAFLAGFLISNISFFFGIWFFLKLIENFKLKIENWLIVFILAFPTSFFFGAIYTEGLFFFLFIAALYFLKKKNYLLSGIFAFLASFTKLMGVFLIIPIAIKIFQEFSVFSFQFSFKSKFSIIKFLKFISSRLNRDQISNLFFPLLGFLIYCFYLWQTTGDPFFFLNSQPIFGAHRSTNLVLLPQVYWRYFKILFTANHDFRYYVSLFELMTFTFVFTVLVWDLIRIVGGTRGRAPDSAQRSEHWREGNSGQDPQLIGLSIFSLTNLLLPTLTGTFSSVPRYALLSISFFIFLATIKNNLVKITLAIIFLIFHILILGFFGQGYFIG